MELGGKRISVTSVKAFASMARVSTSACITAHQQKHVYLILPGSSSDVNTGIR